MDQAMNYADILTRVLREESELQPSFQSGLKIASSCDRETGQFLLLVTGWDKERWYHSVLFHAQLIDGKVRIEIDMTEDMKPLLIEAGIRAQDFMSNCRTERAELARMAA